MSFNESINIIKKNIPDAIIQKVVEYKDLYIFHIFTSNPYEGKLDGIYSVNKKTGKFEDFDYLADGVFEVVMPLLNKALKFKN